MGLINVAGRTGTSSDCRTQLIDIHDHDLDGRAVGQDIHIYTVQRRERAWTVALPSPFAGSNASPLAFGLGDDHGPVIPSSRRAYCESNERRCPQGST